MGEAFEDGVLVGEVDVVCLFVVEQQPGFFDLAFSDRFIKCFLSIFCKFCVFCSKFFFTRLKLLSKIFSD